MKKSEKSGKIYGIRTDEKTEKKFERLKKKYGLNNKDLFHKLVNDQIQLLKVSK